MATLLSAHNLHKSYGDKELSTKVVRALELLIEENESIIVTGASGCGKTTLLHLLAGLDLPDQGDIQMNGQAINRLNEGDRCSWRAANLGFVYQFHHLLPEFDALENIMMPLLIRGEATAFARQSAERMFGRTGLAAKLKHRRPAELSGGERQRVAVARAMVGRPRLLLADEPTGNLDKDNAQQLVELMLEQQRQMNASLVVVSHNPDLPPHFSRHLQLLHGQLQPA